MPKSIFQYRYKTENSKTGTNTANQNPTYQLPENPDIRKICDNLSGPGCQTFLIYNQYAQNLLAIHLQLIKHALMLKKSVIILVPEIILTPQYIAKFSEHFSDNLFIFHSGITPVRRKKIWYEIKHTCSAVVLGTRSAIFAPVRNLGLIIVEQEHDASYKEIERHFHYHARDVAVMRSQICQATAVLTSPTPSIESFHNAKIKKYELVKPLSNGEPAVRNSKQIALRLIDMHRSKNRILSVPLQYEIKSCLKNKKLVVLYLNRLGFTRVITCQDCGYIPLCPICAIPLILYREKNSLTCNTCKHHQFAYDYCPQCKGNNFQYQGIGTQKVAAEIKKTFPRVNIVRLDADSQKEKPISGSKNLLTENSILIITKLGIRELDYRHLGLFGIISADTGLFFPDFRAGEKTFQELSQIINQCRNMLDIKIIIQTYLADNYAVYLAVQGNYDKFYAKELIQREKLQYPPYSRLAVISVSSSKPNLREKAVAKIEARLDKIKTITMLGPTLSGPSKKTKKPAYQFLIKLQPNQSLANLISSQDLRFDKISVDINIDPL